MRDSKRNDRIIEELRTLWKDSPDMRFCQLVFVITRSHAGDPVYIEDDLFEAMMLARKDGH